MAMTHQDRRESTWDKLETPWDLIVVGGGITGAGVLRLATHLGLRTLLVEKNDFAWGTSSRSTKLVHGGLRYLAQGQFGVTRESVREREHLVREAPGLIDPLGFLVATYKGVSPKRRAFDIGLAIYDGFARKWAHQYHKRDDFLLLAPRIRLDTLQGGFRYFDAVTDDARLVLRVIQEAQRAGGVALNYVAAEDLLFGPDGQVNGVRLRDVVTNRTVEVSGRAVVNATGAWADELRALVGGAPRIRPSRGSHVIFPAWRLPVAQAITLVHPQDGRPVFVLPWEGTTLAGTTDIDHQQPLDQEPHMTADEVQYVMTAITRQFPGLGLEAKDALSSFAGVRPIIGTGKGDPSKESRAHVVLEERGLVSIAGGKLTTFRCMAMDTLSAVQKLLPSVGLPADPPRLLDAVPAELDGAGRLDAGQRRRLLGRYGVDAAALVAGADEDELERIEGTHSLWAELRWAAREEAVVHLDDLLLRRVRIGLLLPDGAMPWMERIRAVVQPGLGWDDERWEKEVAAYVDLWKRAYAVPGNVA